MVNSSLVFWLMTIAFRMALSETIISQYCGLVTVYGGFNASGGHLKLARCMVLIAFILGASASIQLTFRHMSAFERLAMLVLAICGLRLFLAFTKKYGIESVVTIRI